MAAPVTLNYGDDTDYDAGYTPAGLGSYLKMPEMDTVPKVITGNSFPTIYQSTTNSQSFPVIVNPKYVLSFGKSLYVIYLTPPTFLYF